MQELRGHNCMQVAWHPTMTITENTKLIRGKQSPAESDDSSVEMGGHPSAPRTSRSRPVAYRHLEALEAGYLAQYFAVGLIYAGCPRRCTASSSAT